jgi:hypothetical protein
MPENAETTEFYPVPSPKREGVKSYEQKKQEKKQEKNMHDSKSNPTSPVSRHFRVEKPCRGFAASSIILFAIIVMVMGFSGTTLLGQDLAGTLGLWGQAGTSIYKRAATALANCSNCCKFPWIISKMIS